MNSKRVPTIRASAASRSRATRVEPMRIAFSRAPAAQRDVSPLELFFDLVYVFAIGQLSHHLVAHMNLRTGLETAILALAVFYGWYMVVWGSNWLDPDPLGVRVALVGLMFASLLMSVAIDGAFGERTWLFVTGYLLLQLGRSTFLIAALRGRPHSEHFVNVLAWDLVSGALWLAGAIASGNARLVLWALAVACAYGGVAAQHWLPRRGRRLDAEHAEVAGSHLVERFRLLFIIVLGEIVLTVGSAFTGAAFTLDRLIALSISFAGTVALWWCYFHRTEPLGAQHFEAAEEAGTLGLLGTWTLTLSVLALIGIAVADQLAVSHPGHRADLGFTALAFGGPALFLVSQIVFQRLAFGYIPTSRAVGLAALAILAPATAPLTLLAGIAASSIVLAGVAWSDTLIPQPRGTAATPRLSRRTHPSERPTANERQRRLSETQRRSQPRSARLPTLAGPASMQPRASPRRRRLPSVARIP